MTRTLLSGGELFDGTGADPAPADVVVEGERIVAVGAPGTGDGDVVVDLAGRTLLPGLFDCHVHLAFSGFDILVALQQPFSYRFFLAAANMVTTLGTGITSVRDAAGADAGVRRAVEDGLVPGPRLQVSIDMLSQTGGHGDETFPCGQHVPLIGPRYPGKPRTVVDGPDEVRRAVRQLVAAGADVIKVATTGGVVSESGSPRHTHLRPAELEVLVEEATAADRFVMAHAQGAEGIKSAVRAGIRSIEHGVFLDDEAIDLMLERGTWLVPTLIATVWVQEALAAGSGLSDATARKVVEVSEAHADSFARAVEAGVKVAMGTDAGVGPHGENLRELPLMASGGMAPAEVLRSSAQEAARLLGVDADLGTVEEGKLADLVAVEGSPLVLDDLASRVRAVWKGGEQVV